MKKIYSFLLVLLMTVMSVSVKAETIIYDAGSWRIEQGSSFLYSSTPSLNLIINDNSVCKDYTSSGATPWAGYNIEEVFFLFDGNDFKVGTYMFADMPELRAVWRWSGTCRIMAYAFYNCPKLEVCQLTGDATYVGDYSFQNCSSLKVAQFSNVKTIGNYAFAGCSSLQKAEFFSGVSSFAVGQHAFDRCSALYQADMEKASTIGEYAFINCYALANIELTKCTSIGQYAFRGCGLETITFGSAIQSIDSWAFHSGIENNGHIYMESKSTPPTTGTDVFSNVNCSTVTLHISESSGNAYNVAPWNQFKRTAAGTKIYGVYNGTTLTLYYDEKMVSRGGLEEWWTWQNADQRNATTKVVLDASMDAARPESTAAWFFKFENLTEISRFDRLHTEKVESMESMFYDCKKLASIDLSRFSGASATDMSGMFVNCESLTELDVNYLDLSRVTLTNSMFSGCKNLERIYCETDWSNYSGNITASANMFYGCTKLKGGRGTVYNKNNVDLTYARPDGGTDAPGYFWRSTDDGLNHEDIDQVQSDKVQSTKVIRDGQLFIIRDGKTFNALGVEIK